MTLKINTLLNLLLLLCAFSFTATADNLHFGSSLLQKTFTAYENKHSSCVESGRALSESTVKRLKKLPNIAADGLGYLSQRAIRSCAEPEYTALMQMLLIMDVSTSDGNKANYISQQVSSIKKVMFSVVDLNLEKKFYDLPDEIKQELDSIESLDNPFDLVDAYERAWGND